MLRGTTAGGAVLVLSLAAVPAAYAGAASPAAAVTASAGAQPVHGLDISSYQHGKVPIDWEQLARDGIRFASVKVSEGTYYTNPYYQSDVRAAAAAGLAVLPYVFANPATAGGAATARFAVDITGSLSGSDQLPLVVDLENDPYRARANCYGLHGGKAAMIGWIGGFVGEARALTGKWPVIYTDVNWWRECAGDTSQFSKDPLWLAAYDTATPSVPSTWGHWTFWQYDNDGRLPGIGTVDLDYYQPTSDLPALRPQPKSASKSVVRSKPVVKRRGRS